MMKLLKVVSVLIIVAVLFCSAALAAVDWASMDEATIKKEIENAQVELEKREGADDSKSKDPNKRTGKATLFDAEGVTIIANAFEVDEKDYTYKPALKISYVVENSSDRNLTLYFDKTAINDWEVDHIGLFDIDAGKKAKGDFKLKMEDAGITSLSEIEKVSFTFHYQDENGKYITTKPKNIKFK